jgi:hypothetical protein
MSAFRVGQKVVCIKGPVRPLVTGANYPEIEHVYTVRAVKLCDYGWDVLLLEEVRNVPGILGIREPGFNASHFRPVAYPPQSLEHDVQTFRKIAGHVDAPESERA